MIELDGSLARSYPAGRCWSLTLLGPVSFGAAK
jgi:hypothetical protein